MRDVRADFPILGREVNGRPLVYLDSAATAQKPAQVLEAMDRYYRHSNANAHRGLHRLAEEAGEALENGRAAVARFIGAEVGEVVFTRGTTESINLVAQGWAARRLRPGDEVLVTELEHHSNFLPWQRVAATTGAVLRSLPVSVDGELPLDGLDASLTSRTRLVAVTAVSNVVGTVVPVERIVRAAKARGIAVLVDAAQAAPHRALRVHDLGCDFLAFSAHKLLGPTGIGVLWGTKQRLEETEPLVVGGGMVREVSPGGATWLDPPRKFEAGTPPVAEAVGLHAAVEYLGRLGMDAVESHARALVAEAARLLQEIPGVHVHARAAERLSAVSFDLVGAHPHDVAAFLDAEGICVRAGHHCAQPLMRRLGVAGTVRASVHVYSTLEEIQTLAAAVRTARLAL